MRLRAFRTGSYDLVIFDQAVRSYSRFDLPVAMVKGVHNGFGPDFSVLGDHFSPIPALLAPLYWIHDGPESLLVAQAVLFALAIWPIWRFAERRLGPGAAYCAAGAYALSWPIAEALAFDFHEVAFVPLLSALLVERYDAGRRGQAAVAAFALLLVKEDMGLLLAGFGLYLLTRPDEQDGERRGLRDLLPRGDRRAGLAYAVVGLVATWVCSRVLIAAFGATTATTGRTGRSGRTCRPAAHALTHPWDVATVLVDPPQKVVTMALLVLPLLLLPLASPLTLTAVPLLAERMPGEPLRQLVGAALPLQRVPHRRARPRGGGRGGAAARAAAGGAARPVRPADGRDAGGHARLRAVLRVQAPGRSRPVAAERAPARRRRRRRRSPTGRSSRRPTASGPR